MGGQAAGTLCVDCGAPLHPRTVKRGRTRCRSCAAKARQAPPEATRFGGDPALTQRAVRRRLEVAAESKRLAQLAREAGLG